MSNHLDKALLTNSSQMPPIDKKSKIDEFREPNFNQAIIQKRIDELNSVISDLQKCAFATKVCNGVTYCGCDIVDLQAKIAIRDSLIENMKTEKLR